MWVRETKQALLHVSVAGEHIEIDRGWCCISEVGDIFKCNYLLLYAS